MLLMLAASGSAPERVYGPVRHVVSRTAAAARGLAPAPTYPVEGTTSIVHEARADARDLRLVYTAPLGAAYQVRASLTVGAATRRVTFAGDETGTVPGQGVLVSDPVPVTVTPGSLVRSTTWTRHTSETGTRESQVIESMTLGDWATLDDRTAPGSTGSGLAGTYRVRGPVEIIGPAELGTVAVAVGGDSIASGATAWPYQWLDRAGVAWTSYSQSGEGVAHMASRRAARYPRGLAGYTHYLCQYGINDCGANIQDWQARYITFWTWVASFGTKIIQSTILPASNIPNASTGEGQTPVATLAPTRTAANSWLRDGAPIKNGAAAAVGDKSAGVVRVGQAGHPVWRVLEICPAVESTTIPGTWRTDRGAIWGDGIHPSTLGYDRIVAALPATYF